LRQIGFFVRVENWFANGYEKSDKETPDLDIWLPKSPEGGTDFFIEVKHFDANSTLKKMKGKVKPDLQKLLKKRENNVFNGFLAFGFAEDQIQQNKLKKNFKGLSKFIEAYNFKKINDFRTVSFEDIDFPHFKSAIIGLWYREKGVTN
jgi:hypothetical protein